MSKVLVTNSTGKVGREVCRALAEKGFEVFGTTRSTTAQMWKGVTPVQCNYTVQSELEGALKSSGAKLVFVITDFFGAAKSKRDVEIAHGKAQIDACKASGVEHVVYSSACDLEHFSEYTIHIKSKIPIEAYLKESGLSFTILRPTAFLDNLDDPANWSPLKKGHIAFMSTASFKWVACYDIGKCVAAVLSDFTAWRGKTIDVQGWEGSIADVAAALTKVSGTPTTSGLAMPLWVRRLMFNDLHYMFQYYETDKVKGSIEDFKKIVPDALDAEGWLKHVGKYSNGEVFYPRSS